MYSYNVSFEITILNVRFFFCSCFFWCWILLLMCNACDFTKYHLQPLLVKFLVDFTNYRPSSAAAIVISGWFYQILSSAAAGVISWWILPNFFFSSCLWFLVDFTKCRLQQLVVWFQVDFTKCHLLQLRE